MITRRQLLQLSLMASLAPAARTSAQPELSAKVSGSAKKGLGLTVRTPDWQRKIEELRCKWFYSWGSAIPEGVPEGTDFVPMIWGFWGEGKGIAKAGEAAKAAGIKELLGFNEPDKDDQANLSVETALDAWPLLMETGLRLGSPGCVHPDREWMKEFMQGAKERELRVDFVTVHSYGGPSAAALVKRMEEVYELYEKPIWITEFAVGDWDAPSAAENRHQPAAVLRFMEAVLPRLEALDIVERYAWFPAKPDNRALGTSALFDEHGQLTRLGECYRDA